MRQYWYLAAALAAVSALTVYVCIKAYGAVKKRSGERNKLMERLKYENRLKAQFRGAGEQALLQAEHARLFEGVALLVSERIEKQKDISVLYALGANRGFIQRIFISEGILLALIGAGIGMLLAIFLVWLQVKFELIKLQGGSFLISY